MQPIEKQVHDAFEIVSLEKLFEEEIKCESKHEPDLNPHCSIEVTHRVQSCVDRLDECASAARVNLELMDLNWTCTGCKRRARDCWTVRPI
jgi:hypothetical protein